MGAAIAAQLETARLQVALAASSASSGGSGRVGCLNPLSRSSPLRQVGGGSEGGVAFPLAVLIAPFSRRPSGTGCG
jgi:hypothetical protein